MSNMSNHLPPRRAHCPGGRCRRRANPALSCNEEVRTRARTESDSLNPSLHPAPYRRHRFARHRICPASENSPPAFSPVLRHLGAMRAVHATRRMAPSIARPSLVVLVSICVGTSQHSERRRWL